MKIERDVNGIHLILECREVGSDLLVSIFGGDEYHIGGVAIAYPTQSHYRDAVTITLNSISFPGHKDYIVANSTAEAIAKALEKSVVVTAGIHVDNASREQIEAIVAAVNEMTEDLIKHYK